MKAKKLTFTALAALMAISAFAGCKQKDYTNDPTTWESLQSGEVVQITFAGRDVDSEKVNYQNFVNEFNMYNDQIVVDLEWWSDTKAYNAAFDGMVKDLPDVFMLTNQKFLSYAAAKKVADIKDHLSEGVLSGLYNDGYEVYYFDHTTKTVGKSANAALYGLPKDQGPVALCINEDLLKEKVQAYNATASEDIDLDKVMSTSEPMKFSYFLEIGEKLKTVMGQNQYVCSGYDLQSIVYSNNANFFTDDTAKTSAIDSANFIGAMEFIQNMYKKGILPSAGTVSSGAETVFTSGNAIFYYAAPYKTKDYWQSCSFDWDLLPVLCGDADGAVSTAYVGGMCYAISANCKYKDAALKFVEYLATNTSSQRTQYKRGQCIPNLISLADEYINDSLELMEMESGKTCPTNRGVWIDVINGVSNTDKITGRYCAESFTYNNSWYSYLNTFMSGQTGTYGSFWEEKNGSWVNIGEALRSYKPENQAELTSLYDILQAI